MSSNTPKKSTLEYCDNHNSIDDNRYRGTPDDWKMLESQAQLAAWRGRLIKEEEFKKLSLYSQMRFSTRCAIRAHNLLKKYWKCSINEIKSINELINFLTNFSCGKINSNMNEIFREVDKKYRACGKVLDSMSNEDIILYLCIATIYDAGRVIARASAHLVPLENLYTTYRATTSCFDNIHSAAFLHAGEKRCQIHRSMEADFELLLYSSEKEKWKQDTEIDVHFFSWHSEFDILYRFEFGNIREIAQGISAACNDEYIHYPREIFEMPYRQRNSLYTILLSSFGFCVEFLIPSKNKSMYFIGIKHIEHNLKGILLLSRFAPGGREALVAVNRLHGLYHNSDNYLLFSTAFLIDNPYRYDLRIAPGFLKKFTIQSNYIEYLESWLSQHQDLELNRYNQI